MYTYYTNRWTLLLQKSTYIKNKNLEVFMKIGIVGYGHVGKAMHELFTNAVIYDKFLNIGSCEEINTCDVAFVCVPTPRLSDGKCDTSIVEEVVSWLNVNTIILRSTVEIGFTDYLMNKYKKEIVFQPEYYGETTAHPFRNLNERMWLSFGGNQSGIDMAIKAYQTVINSNVKIYQCDAKTAEMAKYMENAFLATKVIFCNEMYDIAKALGVNYNLAREIWIADPRIGASHTFVYEDNRGYGGSCLPKDISSLLYQAQVADIDAKLISSVIEKNNFYKTEK